MTKRLKLRKYRMEDAKDLYEKFGCDPQMYEYSGWNPYATYSMAEATVRKFTDSYARKDFYGWAVEYQGQLIGTVGAYDHDPENDQIEIGISIERNSWGNGFAAEALAGVLDYLTTHEKIGKVTAWCAAENAGSMKAMRKAGMKQTLVIKNGLEIAGKMHDKHFFSYSIK